MPVARAWGVGVEDGDCVAPGSLGRARPGELGRFVPPAGSQDGATLGFRKNLAILEGFAADFEGFGPGCWCKWIMRFHGCLSVVKLRTRQFDGRSVLCGGFNAVESGQPPQGLGDTP
jgi:hypothetical protein